MHLHALDGCKPTPLAHYLKALAILRLVSEQADATARGFWRDDRFVLATKLSAEELRSFFLYDYAPTPLIAPWNGGSGFYPKDKQDGIAALEKSTTPRFERYRRQIAWGRQTTAGWEQRPNAGPQKTALIQSCREQWPDQELHWLDAAVAVLGDDLRYPALLGTGGNDGRLDFTNNFMQRLAGLFDDGAPRSDAAALLDNALLGSATSGMASGAAVGQFFPGAAGGMNAGEGYDAKSLVNPWDFVLMLEGAIAFQVATVRQLDSTQPSTLSAPFALRPRAAGYGSATRSEESARGEQWMPLWSHPARYSEIGALLREGRIRDGRSQAHDPLEAAKALAAHGTARGIDAFQRFGYIERNGQSNLAVPLGRWKVQPSPAPRLLDTIEPWVNSLRRASRDEQRDPNALRTQVRGLETSMLALTTDPRPARVQDLLMRLGEAQLALGQRPKHTAGQRLRPMPSLGNEWLAAADDGSVEFRLAVALATQRVGKTHDDRKQGHGMLAYMLPLESPWRFSQGTDSLHHDTRVVWRGGNLTDDLIRVLQRRTTDSGKSAEGGLGFRSRVPVPLCDVAAFLAEQTDDQRIARLVAGLASAHIEGDWRPRFEPSQDFPPDAYSLLRTAVPCYGLDDEALPERVDGALVRTLTGGRLQRAAALASRRITASGHRPKLHTLLGDTHSARRLAASLLFPISKSSQRRLLRTITYVSEAQGANV